MSSSPQTLEQIAKLIDHSLLHPTMTDQHIRTGLEIARRYGCATACVKPYSVPMAKSVLAGSGVGVCVVVGFPHGNSQPEIKVAEAMRAIDDGATEIDVVVNIGKVLSGDWNYVANELGVFNRACVERGAIVKVIFENDYLQDSHIIRLCEICTEKEIAFVKTSSGYGYVKQPSGDYNYKGATEAHLALMRKHSGPKVQVKAAGGVRSLDDVYRVVKLGVTRIGATATEAIIADAVKRGVPGKAPAAFGAPAAPVPGGY